MCETLISNGPAGAPSGYEQLYNSYAQRLCSLDFAEAAPRLGLELCGNSAVEMHFLGRGYHIDREGVTPLEGAKTSFNHRSVLAYYLLSAGSGEPNYEYSLLNPAREGLHTGGLTGLGWMNKKLAKAAAKHFGAFCTALERLGCEKLPTGSAAKHLWNLPLLPKIPAQVLCYEADEEFPCEVKLLYDTGAHRFMEFEALAFLNGSVVDSISHMIKEEVGEDAFAG